MNEIMTEEIDINDETFWNHLKYQIPSFLAKDLITAKQVKNEKLVNNVNERFINWKNAINKKEISENENPNKIVNIVEKIFNLNKQQKSLRTSFRYTYAAQNINS